MSDIKTIPGPDRGYVDMLDEVTTAYIEKEANTKGGFSKTPLRPSASGECTRALFYQLMEFHGKADYKKVLKSTESHRLLNLGHSIEGHVLHQFKLLADMFEIRYKQQVLSFEHLEAKNNPELSQWIEGSLDLVFWSTKYKCVADIKSKKDKFSGWYRTDWDNSSYKLRSMKSVQAMTETTFWVDNLEEFLDELNDVWFAANFLQLNMYANNPFLKERGIDHGAIIQYNKNDSRLREIRFRPSESLYNKVMDKFRKALDAVDNNGNEKLAPRDHNLGSLKCRFCPYSRQCWQGADATEAFLQTFQKFTPPTPAETLGLTELVEEFASIDKAEGTKDALAQKIMKIMLDNKVSQVVHNNQVWEMKKGTNKGQETVNLKRGKLWES